MFRSHSDRRHMPSLTTSPSLGNYMAISSRDGLVTAPCVPAPIQPSGFLRARLRSSFDHPDSVPCFPHAPATDEIASALGLQTQSVLEYPKPMPVSRYDELIDHLEALTLEDGPAPVSLGNSGYVPGAMATPRSMTAPRSMAAPRSMTTPRSVATPRSMDTAISAMFAQERAMTSSAGHPAQGRTDDVYNWGQGDEMSSVEFHNPTRQAHTSGNVDGVQHPNSGPNLGPNSGPNSDPNLDPNPTHHPTHNHNSNSNFGTFVCAIPGLFTGSLPGSGSGGSVPASTRNAPSVPPACLAPLNIQSRKRLRTPNRNSRGSRASRGSSSRSDSPQALVRALVTSSRSDSAPASSRAARAPRDPPADMSELQYLVTYNLVNNFYFNLVSWSRLNNSIAIAIESKAYWWDGSSHVRDMNIQRPGLAPVSCVSCSSGDAMAVSFSDGFFCIYQITKRRPPISRRFAAPVQCVEWFPDATRLFVGDSTGSVTLLAYDGASIVVVSHLTGFTQQICGIALNSDASQVAVGANENLAIVWDISTPTQPQEQCRLRHKSAVKGISFCPWAPSLLATGGGSNDRHLRFWHTRSGTLLRELDTQRQITAVFWSSFYKELLLTFGFSTAKDHIAAAIYQYPEARITACAYARDPLRALSATVAPDQTKVAIAANDGTVRVFGLWGHRPHALTASPASVASGSYGSSVVERCEGVDIRSPSVR